MAQVALGFEEIIGVGIETTYGTAVAPTRFFRPISTSLAESQPAQPAPGMSGGKLALYHPQSTSEYPREWKGPREVTGSIEIDIDFEEIGIFLANAVCQSTSTSPDGYLRTTNSHTFAMLGVESDDPVDSLTVVRYTGTNSYTYSGCMVNGIEINGEPDSPITASIDLIGAKLAVGSATPSESYPVSPIAQFHQSAVWFNPLNFGAAADSGTEISANSWTFSLTNNLRSQGQSNSSDRIIRHPVRDDFANVTFTVTKDWDDSTWDEKWQALGAFDGTGWGTFTCTTTGPAIVATGSNYKLQMFMPAARVQGNATTHGGGAGAIPEEIVFEAGSYFNGSAITGFQFVLVNDSVADYDGYSGS